MPTVVGVVTISKSPLVIICACMWASPPIAKIPISSNVLFFMLIAISSVVTVVKSARLCAYQIDGISVYYPSGPRRPILLAVAIFRHRERPARVLGKSYQALRNNRSTPQNCCRSSENPNCRCKTQGNRWASVLGFGPGEMLHTNGHTHSGRDHSFQINVMGIQTFGGNLA